MDTGCRTTLGESGSRFVGSQELRHLGGEATKTESRESVAHKEHDVCLRLRTKTGLKHPPILLNQEQIDTISSTIHLGTQHLAGTPLLTCAVVADHAHILIGRTPIDINEIVVRFKEETVKALLEKGIHPRVSGSGVPAKYTAPLDVPASVWSVGCWKVYINTPEHLEQTKRYIEKHLQ